MDISEEVDHEIEKNVLDNKKSVGVLFFRQAFVSSTVILNFLMIGLYMGAPTVIIPQIRKESKDDITPQMVSWLSSISFFFSLPWTIIIPVIAHRFGRKPTLLLLTVNTFIGNVIFYRSTSFTELLISLAIQGMLMSSIYTISVMVLSEYVSPQYRGLIMTFKAATFFWGVWISNTLGTFLPWRVISIIIFVICIYNLSIIFCPESPYWLAVKGRFEECAKSHRWMRGTDPNSEHELRTLIITQKSYAYTDSKENIQTNKNTLIRIYKTITEKQFYKPLFYNTLIVALHLFSGKIAYTVYAIEIIKKITSNERTAYIGMLIIDGVTVLCAYIGCFLTYALKRRTQLLWFSTLGVGFLFSLSFFLYMMKLNYMSENKYLSLVLLVGFSICLSCGPLIILACCFCELVPLKNRSSFLIVFSIIASLLSGLVLKISPFIFTYFECHGAFLFYGITASLLLVGLYRHLPETKNKTIQEIENLISGEKIVIEETKESIPLKSIC